MKIYWNSLETKMYFYFLYLKANTIIDNSAININIKIVKIAKNIRAYLLFTTK